MPDQKNIETGVDKLVELVNRKQRVALKDAAKELGIGEAVVQEWADFLEDEGLISIEDRLSKTFLCERKLSQGEVEKKTQEYSSKKDAFVRKVETAISSLQKESEGLDRIKQEFEKLKDAIGGDIDMVKEELSELRHYEDLKKNIDKEVLQQRLDYQSMIDGVRRKITEEKKLYESFLDTIGGEKGKVEEVNVELSFLQKKQETLQKRFEALQIIMKSVQEELDQQRFTINESLETIHGKVADAEKIREQMKSKIDLEIDPILKKVKDNEERILAVQSSILQKIVAKHKEIDKYKLKSTEAAEKLKSFFQRRANIEGLLATIEKDKAEIEKDLKSLIDTAQKFNLSIKSSDVKKHIKNLGERLKKIDRQKQGLKTKLEKLTELVKQKD
ncbi:hypothetical protein JW826_05650 [Candidatus Woesearchaeota archaeon]|nr:hypothetical protein [Candidatus Woesearchaeota archaeon]